MTTFRLCPAWIGAWMALATCAQGQSVVIHELHYHPSSAAVQSGEDPEDLQFLELYNAGGTVADLSGWSFTQGIAFVFPAGTTLDPGEYLVVAEDASFLSSHVTLPPEVALFDWTSGDLSNAGEVIELVDAQAAPAVVDVVEYDDVAPWPAAADGSGPSLELVHPALDNSYPSVWRASAGMNGTPGAGNSVFSEGPVVLTEDPARLSVITVLPEVQVTFAEPVRYVAAGNLSVNSSLATDVSCPSCTDGVGAGPYIFSGFASPTSSPIQVALAPGAIEDLEGHPFPGDIWFYSFDTPAVVINELHYHPVDPYANAEFIELYNDEPDAVDISGWHLTEFASPGYVFPPQTVLSANGYVVVTKDPALLESLTGCSTPHSWGLSDSLSNSGEPVALKNELGVIVDRVVYSDASPWPLAADGEGPSLELISPDLDNGLYGAWAASLQVHGTPGALNSVTGDHPHLVSETPPRRTATETLAEVTVVFSEPVTGVSPEDLVVGGSAATAVDPSSGPADTYTFNGFAAPNAGSVALTLNAGGIVAGTVPFIGDTWTVAVGTVVVLNELHYHPADPNGDAEFMELHNAGTESVELDGWVLSDGVEYVFPTGSTLPAGGYFVLALNPAVLQQVTGHSGAVQWTSGRLDNGGERVALSDGSLNLIDAVEYVDRGSWPSLPDGDGPSLELVNPRFPNEYGPAWQASVLDHGTPGAPNSVYQPLVSPIVVQTEHSPAIPAPQQDVVVRALVIDDDPDPTVTLYYRQDADPTLAYNETPMLDDGFHGDGAAGDRVYGAIVPGVADGERLDFTIRADDGVNVGAGPPGHDTLVAGEYPAQTYLCPFIDAAQSPAADFPAYHLITTQRTRNLQSYHTETEYDATFIHRQATGAYEVFYNVIEHYRGASSLHQHPHSFHIKFAEDQALDSEMGFPITRLILNAQSTIKQHLGNRMFRESFGGEVFGSHTQFVRLHTSPLSHGGIQNYIYINVERLDDDYLESQGGAVAPARFPDRCTGDGTVCNGDAECPPGESCMPTAGGNLYRGRYNDAHLRWEGWDPSAYMVDAAGANGYELENNEDNHDWTDLINLCYALDASTTPDDVYEQSVRQRVDEEQWARWFALHMLLANQEGGIYRDTGDDYYIYFRPAEAHDGHSATLLAWDLDSTFGGFTGTFNSTDSIWRTTVPSPQRFLRSNAFAGRFVKAIDDLLNTTFAQPALDTWIDAVPDAVFTQHGQTKSRYKVWANARRVSVNSEIRRQLTLAGVPDSPYASPDPVIPLSGQLNQVGTHHVLINGRPVDAFSVYEATWSHALTLRRGANPILVQCMDYLGQEVSRVTAGVQYDPPPASIRITAPTRMVNTKTWTAKAELLDNNGQVDWRIWNALGTVSATRVSDGTPVPTSITVFETLAAGAGGGRPPEDSIRFYNGVGSVSITLDGGAAETAGDIEVTVGVSGVSAVKVVTVLDEATPGLFRNLSGVLSGDDLVWGPADGVIHLTGDVTVNEGNTLSILPGTLVMVDSGPANDGVAVTGAGVVQALGTQSEPIFFFPTAGPAALTLPQDAQNNTASWRGFYFWGTGSSQYLHVFVTGAGNGTLTSSPRPPIFHSKGSAGLILEDCVVADCPGMGHWAAKGASGVYQIRRSLFSRVGAGGEWLGSGYALAIEDSWFTRIGRAADTNGLNGDVFHFDRSDNTVHIRRCVLTDGGDDVIEHTAGAAPVVEDCVLYDVRDAIVSLDAGSGGSITFTNCLVFMSPGGIRCPGAAAYLTHCTVETPTDIDGRGTGSLIQSTVLWPNSASTCVGSVEHTLVGSADDLGCGVGNLCADPLFAGASIFDYTLEPESPARTAGPAGGRIGWLGFPTPNTCAIHQDCDDADPCTDDLCDVGVCDHTYNANPCDDGLNCTDNDVCASGTCVGTAIDCSGLDDPCNTGVCDEPTGACLAEPVTNGTPCDDDDLCTQISTCMDGVCVGTTPLDCDDANVCTVDSCHPALGCQNTPEPDGTSCSNAEFCDGEETCQSGVCVAGTDPCTGDCEQCDEDLDVCDWCMFDLDQSEVIGGGDFGLFAGCFGACYPPGNPCLVGNFDADSNGCVGGGDFGLFSGCFAQTCGECPTCFGPPPGERMADPDDGSHAALALVAVGMPTLQDVVFDLPSSSPGFVVGGTFWIEVWAQGRRVMDGRKEGLAAVYADVSFAASRMTLEAVRPGDAFPLFVHGTTGPTKGLVEAVGGCAPLGEATLGTGGAWVCVARLQFRAASSGPAEVRSLPARLPYGVAVVNRFGELTESQVEFGQTTLRIRRPALEVPVRTAPVDAAPVL